MKKLKQLLAMFMAICMMFTFVPIDTLASENTDAIEMVEEKDEESESEVTEGTTEEAVEESTEEPMEGTGQADTDESIVTGEVIASNASTISTFSTVGESAATDTNLGTKPSGSTVEGEPFDQNVSKNHRIPGIVTLNDGTLVASADARWDDEKDGGGLDVVVSKSTDNGATWNYTYAGYLGDNGNEYNAASSTMMDPLIITDGEELYLFSDIFPAGYSLGISNTTYGFSATGTGFDSAGRLLLGTTYTSTECAYYLENGLIYNGTTNEAVAGYTVDEWFNVYENETYVSNLFFADSPYVVYPTSYICMQSYDKEQDEWSAPELLNIKQEGTAWQVLGPGSGLVTTDGEIAFTAYDGSSIYLVHGTSGDWKVVNTSAAVNESSIVELSDGTIRAFVKNSNNKITYVDFTKDGDTYVAGTAKSTSVANTGWCMVSSMKYSKLINGQEAIFVCCPTDSQNGSVRCNGTISVFLLDEDNNMSLLTSYQVNSDFFAYSDMTEINDGKNIALLYEDGCQYYTSGSNGVGYSHIKYVNLAIDEILEAVDACMIGENVTVKDEATDVTVTAPDLQKVVVKEKSESTPAEGFNKSVTYSIELFTSEDAAYTGAATVKVPAGELAGCQRYIGTVTGTSGSDDFEVAAPVDGYFTLNVPHFSEVTVSGYALETEKVDITLYPGISETVTISDVEYSDTDVNVKPEDTKATIVSVETIPGETIKSAEQEVATALEDGESYLIYINGTENNLLSESTTQTWSQSHLKAEANSEGNVTDLNAWTLEGTTDGYYIKSSAGEYLNLTATNNEATLGTTGSVFFFDWDDDAKAWVIGSYIESKASNQYLNNLGDSGTHVGGWTGNVTKFDLYKINTAVINESTKVTFKGVGTGNTTAQIGHVIYNITVKDVVEGDLSEFNHIVGVDTYTEGSSVLNMSGQMIKKLTISAGASFKLGVDITDYDDINWTSEDEAIAQVDESGEVSILSKGITQVTATVVKDGIKESISVTINAMESYVDENVEPAEMAIYISEAKNTKNYYTLYFSNKGSTAAKRLELAEEGEMIYLLRPIGEEMGLLFTSAQDDGYILTFMSATGSDGHYYPLQDGNKNLQTGKVNDVQYYSGSTGYNNLAGSTAGWKDDLDAVLAESVTQYNCFGGQSFSRAKDKESGLVTSLSFIAETVPQVSKSVQGLLPPEGVKGDFKPYVDGMVAAIEEQAYFKITVTLERPIAWKANTNETEAAREFTNAILTEQLEDAYFYTKELDLQDGTWDGIIKEELRDDTLDITNDLNAVWETDDEVRTLTYYVVYTIQEKDIPNFILDNTVKLDYSYHSTYAAGDYGSSANAKASITVVGESMDDTVIDFGKKITITGLDNKYLKYALAGDNTVGHQSQYGKVVVDKRQCVDDAGNELFDGNGYPIYDYTVTYTPTEIMQGPDAIEIWGEYNDNEGEKISRTINGFTVYPATTMHYEESFINWDSTKWSVVSGDVGSQTYQKLGGNSLEDQSFQNYGYDESYKTNLDNSNNTYATASQIGAKGTFKFKGTGLDVYAKCTAESGSVYVQLKNSAGKSSGLYIVDTVAKNGISDATEGQAQNLYGMPIVSVRGLKYDTYEVTIKKCSNTRPVYIDGIRIYGTIEDSVRFTGDYEDYPEFYEMRDAVLSALNVGNDTSEKYGSLEKMAMQIYSGISDDTEQPAAILNGSSFATEGMSSEEAQKYVQDLLDNGPKNELFLHQSETLVFSVKTSRLMQIGLKAPAGETKYTISGVYKEGEAEQTFGGDEKDISTSVDMFYSIGNPNGTEYEYTITITNEGSNILSVTDLKICDDPNAAFQSLTEKDIEFALKEMGYASENDTAKAPVITKQPVNGEAKMGERYSVEVLAEGEGLKYQWYGKNAGASGWFKSSVTDNTYDDVMTKSRAGREVYCVITDANGNSVTTDTVKLVCIPGEELAIVTQPVDGEAVLGERYCVTVEAKGEGLKYQWYFRNPSSNVWHKSGVKDNTYDDVLTRARMDREVYCVITDVYGNQVTSDVVKLVRVPMKLEITSQPTDSYACFGEEFCVTVEAKGEGVKYQWYYRNAGAKNWRKSGVKDNTYDDVMTKSRANREVYCVVTDAYGNQVTSDIAKLIPTAKVELKLLGQTYESAAMGERYCVTVDAQGEDLTYRWYFRNAGSENWFQSGVKDNTYDDVMTRARANREVYCIVTDSCGTQIVTDVVTLTVDNEI